MKGKVKRNASKILARKLEGKKIGFLRDRI
jgi:hypothetical protein